MVRRRLAVDGGIEATATWRNRGRVEYSEPFWADFNIVRIGKSVPSRWPGEPPDQPPLRLAN